MTLDKIAWVFKNKVYTDLESFNTAVTEYQLRIGVDPKTWVPSEIVVDAPCAQIQYEAWVDGQDDLLSNEKLIEEDIDAFETETDEDGYQVEIVAKFTADNGKNFSALEFLMKTHNQMANKELGDHIFFEGLQDPETNNGVTTFQIYCGS